MDEQKMDAAIADRKSLVESAAPAPNGGGSQRKVGGGEPKDVKALLEECRA